MSRMSVGVLRGGMSSGYGSSLKSGARVVQSLPEEQYNVRDILIDRNGLWHMRGLPVSPMRALSGVDVIVNALYNDGIGTDGEVARILKQSAIPYTGTRGTTASLARNRTWVRSALADMDMKMPRGQAFSFGRQEMNTSEMARHIFAEFGPPYLVKPVSSGHAINMCIANTVHDLPEVLADMFEEHDSLLVEEYMPGEYISVGVIEDFRNEPFYALPPSQLTAPVEFSLPDLKARMNENTFHTCPCGASKDYKKIMMDSAREAHQKLGLSHYSRADFVLRGTSIYLVGVNAFPELHDGAAFPSMLEAVGSDLSQFVDHLLVRARN